MTINYRSDTYAIPALGGSSPNYNFTVDKPAGVVAGDVLILFFFFGFNSTDPNISLSGWTKVSRQGFNSNMTVLWKIASGSEPASYTFSTTGGDGGWNGNNLVAYLAAYSGAVVVRSSQASASTTTGAQASLAFPSTSTISPTDKVVRFGGSSVSNSSQSADNISPSTGSGIVLRESRMGSGSFVRSVMFDENGPATPGAITARDYNTFAYIGTATVVLGSNTAPNAPTQTAPAVNEVLDRAITNRFAWTPSDPDPGDSQSKFDLRYRLIGAGTWTDVTGTTPNAFWDAVGGTFAAGDYEWQVRTYDAQGAVGPYCASGFFSAGNAPATPTITAPINGATVAASESVTWSTPAQARYQVRRVADNAGTADPSIVYFDTGEVVDDTTRSLTVAFPTNNRWEHVQQRIKDGGLWSPWADARVNVSWTPPASPTAAWTAVPASGAIDLAITNPAPGAGEPTVTYNDVWLSAAGVPGYRAATLVPPNSTWRFWGPTKGVDYVYRVVAVASNGTTAETTVS